MAAARDCVCVCVCVCAAKGLPVDEFMDLLVSWLARVGRSLAWVGNLQDNQTLKSMWVAFNAVWTF